MLYIKNNKTKKFVKEKLKTLNELEEGEYLFKGLVKLRHVREEIIKWIKHLRYNPTRKITEYQARILMEVHNITEKDLK